MNRRAVMLGGVAMAAVAAGAGSAWWRSQKNAPGRGPAGSTFADIWDLRFDQPDGGELVLARFKGQPLLLNFWATWCPPCVTEMPLLDRFHADQQARGWQVVGLAVDSPTPVREFLARKPMRFPVGLAGLGGVELAQALGNASGALPFTVVFDRKGKSVQTKLGALHEDDLTEWARSVS